MAKHLGDMLVVWDANLKDFRVEYPENEEDGQLAIEHVLSEEFLKELEKRGFDLTTLQFTVRLHTARGGRPGPAYIAMPPAAAPTVRRKIPKISKEGIVIPEKPVLGQVQGRLPGVNRH